MVHEWKKGIYLTPERRHGSDWLRSEVISSQEKVRVLTDWLMVELLVLRFGEAVRNSIQQHKFRWDEGS